jgi:ABC-type nitrate/sulfonate/bicarbonate transport system permease component
MTRSEFGEQDAPAIALRRHRQAERIDRFYRIWIPVAVALGVIGLWQLLAVFVFTKLILPDVQNTATALVDLLTSGEIEQAIGATVRDWLVGLGTAMFVGTLIGILMGRFRWVHDVLGLYVALLLSAPVVVLIPFVVIVFGFTELSRVLVVFIFVIANVVVTVEAGVRSISRLHVQMARSFGASERQIVQFILVPAVVPAMMTALRAATSRAFLGILVAELSLLSAGVGELLDKYGGRFQTNYVFAAILVVAILGVGSVHTARFLEQRASRYSA